MIFSITLALPNVHLIIVGLHCYILIAGRSLLTPRAATQGCPHYSSVRWGTPHWWNFPHAPSVWVLPTGTFLVWGTPTIIGGSVPHLSTGDPSSLLLHARLYFRGNRLARLVHPTSIMPGRVRLLVANIMYRAYHH